MRYRAKRGLSVPMPDRAGTNLPDSGEGASVDPTSPYYARLIADGDIVAVENDEPQAKAEEAASTTANSQSKGTK